MTSKDADSTIRWAFLGTIVYSPYRISLVSQEFPGRAFFGCGFPMAREMEFGARISATRLR
jgi:hypothetical protein